MSRRIIPYIITAFCMHKCHTFWNHHFPKSCCIANIPRTKNPFYGIRYVDHTIVDIRSHQLARCFIIDRTVFLCIFRIILCNLHAGFGKVMISIFTCCFNLRNTCRNLHFLCSKVISLFGDNFCSVRNSGLFSFLQKSVYCFSIFGAQKSIYNLIVFIFSGKGNFLPFHVG